MQCAQRRGGGCRSRHHFLELPARPLGTHFEPAAELCSGLYTYDGALFLGLSAGQPMPDVVSRML